MPRPCDAASVCCWSSSSFTAPLSKQHIATAAYHRARQLRANDNAARKQGRMQRLSHLPVTSELQYHSYRVSNYRPAESTAAQTGYHAIAGRAVAGDGSVRRARASFYLLISCTSGFRPDRRLHRSACVASIQSIQIDFKMDQDSTSSGD